MVKPRTCSRPGTARTTGLILAGAFLAIFAGVIGFFVLRASPNATRDQVLTTTEAPPDIKLIQSGSSPTTVNSVGSTSGFFLQIVDELDPTLVRGEINAARSEPLEARSYRLDKPRGWMFLKDGRTVYLESDTGQAYVPDDGANARPRDGVLEGNVVVRLFPALAGGERPDPATQEPIVIAKTDLLRFDGAMGKVEVPNDITIHADSFDFAGGGLTLLYNEQRQQLESLRILRHKHAEYRPGVERKSEPAVPATGADKPALPGTPKPATTDPDTDQRPPAPRPASAPLPVETLYRLVCGSDVVLTQAGRRITADQLEVWVRMIDNKIPDGAVPSKPARVSKRPSRFTPRPHDPALLPIAHRSTTESQPPIGDPPGPSPQAPAARSALPSSPDDAKPVVLSWSGPLEVRPLTTNAGELAFNHLFVRFTSTLPNGVTITDERSRASAFGSLLDYGVTKRELALASNTPLGAKAVLTGSGEGLAERFDIDLNSGDVHISGPGVLTAAVDDQSDTARHRELSWLSQADFDFAVVDGEMTSRLIEARASGGVVATDGPGQLTGASFTAIFVPIDQSKSRIEHLKVVGQVVGKDGKDGQLSSDTLDVAFEASGDATQSDPSLLTAQGSVRGVRGAASLEADLLEAHISRSAEKELVITRVDARESVVFADDNGVRATADHLDADPVAQTAVLTGSNVTIARQETTVSGQKMKLENVDRRLTVLGAGNFEHNEPGVDGEPGTHATATWSRQLTVEDKTGSIECDGSAHAEWARGPLAKDILDADLIRFTISPQQDSPDQADESEKPERKLLTAEAVGSLAASESGTPASVEVRRYAAAAAPDTEPSLERLLYLQGARILADNVNGTLHVPAAGKLLTMDRRALAEQPQKSQAISDPFDTTGGGARGSSLFQWKESLFMNRTAGTVELLQGVRMTHKRLEDDRTVELEGESLKAAFNEGRQPGASSAEQPLDQQFQGELISAHATGAVWMRSGQKELTSDSLLYDARTKVVHASAQDGNTVTLFDPAATSPLVAKDLSWDLANDKIRVEDLKPVTVPR